MTAVLEKRLLLGLLVFSALVRIAFYLELKDTDLAAVPLLDSQTYHEWAARLVAGDWGWHETYWMGPLYPHLLAVVYVIFGIGSQAALVLQLGLSLLNIVLLHRFVRAALGDHQGSRITALLSATLFALYGAPVFYAGNLLMATLVTTLFLVVARQTVRAATEPTWRKWFVLGLVTGIAGLARGNVLVLLPVLPVLLIKGAVSASLSRAGRLKLIAALFLGGSLVLAPVTLRNLLVADDFVILTSNGGVNLLIGQQAAYKGLFAPVMDEAQAEFDPSGEATLERELGRDLKGSEISRILTRQAWDEFSSNLAVMPLHYVRKAYRFWNGYELPQIVSYDFYRREFKSLWALPLPFFVLSGLGLVGAWLLPTRARWILLVLVGGYFLSLLPFFPTSRYRQPVAPLLAMSAATWIVAVVQQTAKRRLWLAGGIIAMTVLLPRWGALSQPEVLWQVHLHEASRASKLGDLAKTRIKGQLAEDVRPGLADTPYHLSLYLEDLNQRREAIKVLEVAAERAPRNRLIPYRIGRNYEELGEARSAVAAFEKAAALDPDWSYPWFRGGLVLVREGRKQEALRAMQQAFELAPGNRRIRSNLASLYAETGSPAKAHRLLVGLTKDYPLYVNGWFNRAMVEFRAGRTAEARASLVAARALRGLTDQEHDQINRLQAMVDGPASQ